MALAHEDWNIPQLKHPALAAAYTSMRFNSSRVRLLLLFPSSVSGFVRKIQRLADIAESEITGRVDRALDIIDWPSSTMGDKITERFNDLYKADLEAMEKLKGTPAWDEQVFKYHSNAIQMIGAMVNNDLGLLSFMPMFAAQLTTMWTAIESLLGDLWEAALNAHPAALATLKGSRTRISKLNESSKTKDQPSQSSDDPRTVPLAWIEEHQFDVKNKWGTILRRQFEFTKLASAREAYSRAFNYKSGRIDQALGSKSLDALNAVRNVLVHKAGMADAEYIKRCSYVPTLPRTPLNQPILLNGKIIVGLIRPSLEAAKNLMIAVDDWITEN